MSNVQVTPKIWFCSDLHFHHTNIVKFTDRKLVTTQEEHTEWLISIWNNQVSAGDIVYHLGDFSFASKPDKIIDVLSRLKGQKFLVKGNHDRSKNLKVLLAEGHIQWFGDYREIRIGEFSTCLFHFPIVAWHRQHFGAYHLHGHCHGSYQPEKGKCLDVGIDNAYKVFGEHRLFSVDDIIEYMSKRELAIGDYHRDR